MQLAHRRRSGAFTGPADTRSLGAVLVEAAFVTPVFFTLVLGIMELGLAMNDNLALAHSVRAGTRIASASGDDLYSDYGVLVAIRRESAALPKSSLKTVVIYETTRFGAIPDLTCRNGNDRTTAGSRCNAYTGDQVATVTANKSKFGCGLNSWDLSFCPTNRDVTRAGGTTYVGVWMKVEHRWITTMFGSVVTLTDSSVIRLEPRQL